MQTSNYILLAESEFIDSHLVHSNKLEKYCTLKNEKWLVSFVGFIINKDTTIISFPKHYYFNKDDIKFKDIRLLAKVLSHHKKQKGFYSLDNEINNFPIKAYLSICEYYKKFGLYSEKETRYLNGYSGKIDWKRTIRKSNKVISGNNLVFLPLVVKNEQDINVFLSECMSFVLSEGYQLFGKYFNIGIKYNRNHLNYDQIFMKSDIVVKQLKVIGNNYFKDTERLLIKNLIDYFSWKSNYSDRIIFLTLNFEYYWENMVERYLNKNLFKVDSTGKMYFKNGYNKFRFSKKTEHVESSGVLLKTNTRKFKVIYDHLYKDEEITYLFDSKYYLSIEELDYKQMSYYYILKTSPIFKNKRIVNGLILPTELNYHTNIHVDRRDVDGLYIIEHYLNVKNVMEDYVNG